MLSSSKGETVEKRHIKKRLGGNSRGIKIHFPTPSILWQDCFSKSIWSILDPPQNSCAGKMDNFPTPSLLKLWKHSGETPASCSGASNITGSTTLRVVLLFPLVISYIIICQHFKILWHICCESVLNSAF